MLNPGVEKEEVAGGFPKEGLSMEEVQLLRETSGQKNWAKATIARNPTGLMACWNYSSFLSVETTGKAVKTDMQNNTKQNLDYFNNLFSPSKTEVCMFCFILLARWTYIEM